ncbi:MAG TPA: DMT family transporter [Ktedonobacterales bacterium]|nr:DMT family transporter [Ktedonobacterales bacterium]
MNQVLVTVLFGLAAALFWGSGDFSGGLASRRAKATSVIIIAYALGFVFLIALALVFREPFPQPSDFLWGGLAGVAGGLGLLAFYSALSSGKMGIAAPVSASLTATLPVLFSVFTVGLPRPLQLGGFALAVVAIALISRPDEAGKVNGSAEGIGLALLAGCGFGLFFILISRVSPATTFGSLSIARFSSVAVLLALAGLRRQPVSVGRAVLPLVAVAGGLDALGNVFFLLAAHSGRLDVAAVVASLYPAATVLLAALVLRERVRRIQAVGIVLALIAIPLISA